MSQKKNCSFNKTYLVTGASRGIGLAIANSLVKEGHRVVGIARQFQKVDFTCIEQDLGKAPSEFYTSLAKQFPGVDGLICNVGKGLFGHLEQLSESQIRELMEVNFFSHVMLIKAFLPLMKKRKSGDILLIGSEAALQGKKEGTIYCASKFAVRGFAQALREECRNCNVRVTLVNPGMVGTSFFDDLHFSPESAIEKEEIARTVSYLLKAPTGVVYDEVNLSPQKKSVIKLTNTLKTSTIENLPLSKSRG